MYPVFFSVSSTDIGFAETIFDHIPDGLTYLYSKTGIEGANLWDEIAVRELPKSKVFVVFWSKSYVTAGGCVREILQAKSLVVDQKIVPVIIRMDDYPITSSDSTDPSLLPVFDALKPMLAYRTSAESTDVRRAADLVQRMVEPIVGGDHPRWPRHDLEPVLRAACQKDRFSFYPVVWISGFNGVGRETLVRDFNRSFVPNGRGIEIEVNETSQPNQMILRLESKAFGARTDRLRHVREEIAQDDVVTLADTIQRVYEAGDYVIFKHTRVIAESEALPSWIDMLANCLKPDRRPKLAVISQLPLLGERRAKFKDSVATQRVATLPEHDLTEFCYQLIAFFDPNPSRWSEPEIERLVKAAGGTIGFLVSLVRSVAHIEDFDTIDEVVADDSRKMASSITAYVRWAFRQLRQADDEQRVLLFLNDVSPCDSVDLAKAVQPQKSMLRVLGKLLELGLIEREGDDLYRLTPLLANRLSKDLIRPDLLQWLRKALLRFIQTPIDVDNPEHEYIRIESRIQASLLTDRGDLPSTVTQFVSAAHWFQAGVRLYHAKRRVPAYRVLKKAYLARDEFVSESRVELTRYYCLSATRNRKYDEAIAAIGLLDKVYNNKGMAAFLNADLLDHQRRYVEAIAEYENSLKLNENRPNRLERTYRPLISCILASSRPDFKKAETYAKRWLSLKQTVFSLTALPRVYLNWKYRGKFGLSAAPEDIDRRLEDAIRLLEADPGAGSAIFELKAEEADLTGDYDKAVAYMDSAIAVHPRFELRTERWRFLAKSGRAELAMKALDELDAAKNNVDYRGNWIPFLPSLTETYALALLHLNRSLNAVNTFAVELSSDEIGIIISRVKRWRR